MPERLTKNDKRKKYFSALALLPQFKNGLMELRDKYGIQPNAVTSKDPTQMSLVASLLQNDTFDSDLLNVMSASGIDEYWKNDFLILTLTDLNVSEDDPDGLSFHIKNGRVFLEIGPEANLRDIKENWDAIKIAAKARGGRKKKLDPNIWNRDLIVFLMIQKGLTTSAVRSVLASQLNIHLEDAQVRDIYHELSDGARLPVHMRKKPKSK